MAGNNVQKFDNAVRVGNFSSAPASAPAGAIYWDTVAQELFVANGTSYSPLAIATSEFSTSVFRLDDSSDPTKKIAFDASGISTGTVRTLKMPDANVDLGNLTNSNISASAAIAYSKLALTGSIVNADVNASAAIAYSKLSLSNSIVNADINSSAAIALSKLAALGNNFALQSNGSGVISVSAVTSTELGYVSGVTSAIQTQLSAKANDNIVIKKDGSVAFTANESMGGFKLTNLAAATANGDAVRFEQAVLTDGSHAITGDQSFSGTAKITNLLDPVSAQDGATKAYVDNSIAGLTWKVAARAASVANVSVSSAPSAIDGVTLSSGDRVLLKDQSAPAENGIYVFSAAASPLTRATDADTWNKLVGAVLYIVEGTVNSGSKWNSTTVTGGTLGTTAVPFTVFAATSSLDGVGTAGYNAYWTAAHTLAAEQYVAASRGGLATDASAFTGVVKASSGVFSASSLVNADVSASAGIVYSKLSLTGSIVNADINSAAAIAYSKLSLTGSIVNADINASAAIAYSKLSLSNSIVNADINSAAAIAYSKLNLALSIVNGDISASAAIAYSKLSLSNSIVNADINSAAAIAYSKLNLSASIVNADVASGAAIARNKLASGTANRVVVNDGSGVMSDAAAITAARALISDANGIPTQSAVTSTELGYVSGVTSAIQTQLNSKLSSVSQDTAPTLGGDLTLNGKAFIGVERRGASNAASVQQEYLEFSLTQSTTAVASSLTMDSRNFKGCSIEYSISNGNDRRKGRLELALNNATGVASTVVSLTDQSTETADILVSWSAAMNSNNVELSYTTGAGTFNMDADIKRFRS